MKYLAQIGLAIIFATGADAAIYAYANRERPPKWGCGFRYLGEREEEAAEARFESHAIGASAIFANATAFVYIGATLVRRPREKERIANF